MGPPGLTRDGCERALESSNDFGQLTLCSSDFAKRQTHLRSEKAALQKAADLHLWKGIKPSPPSLTDSKSKSRRHSGGRGKSLVLLKCLTGRLFQLLLGDRSM